MDKPDQALQWIEEATTSAGFQCGKDVGVLIDVAAERLYDVVRDTNTLSVRDTSAIVRDTSGLFVGTWIVYRYCELYV